MSPTVSVIIPTYNRLSVLGRAIASARSQTYTDKETIVIDDGSEDGTAEWLANQKCDRVICLPGNTGGAAARNAGIRVAQGKYLAFLDSDDEWQPDYLRQMVEALETSDFTSMAYSGYIWKYGEKEIWRGVKKPGYVTQVMSMLMQYFIDGMSNVVIPRSVFDRVGLMAEDLRSSHDQELYLRILHLAGDAIAVECTDVTRYLTPGSIVTTEWQIRANNRLLMIDKFYQLPRTEQYLHLRPLLEQILWKSAYGSFLYQSQWLSQNLS